MLTSAQRYIDTRMISHLTVAKQSSNNISADFFVLFKKLFVLQAALITFLFNSFK
jgi:hypothetical protein